MGRIYPFVEATPRGLYLMVRVQPGSPKNSVAGMHGGALKIKIKAPPIEGRANDGLIAFLSELLGLKRSSITIEGGLLSKDKRVRVEGVTSGELDVLVGKILK